MMRVLYLSTLVLLSSVASLAQKPYRVELAREDGVPIVFNMTTRLVNGIPVWEITNASEKLRVDSIRRSGDSLLVEMPFFDSRMTARELPGGVITGYWFKGTTGADAIMPFKATPGITTRFEAIEGAAVRNISGRYAVSFVRPDGSIRKSVAEFSQKGNRLTGTFLNPSGDYRFLEGIVTGDSLMLSCFDGSHAYYFGARVGDDGSLQNGIYCAGIRYKEPWTAVKNDAAKVYDSGAIMYLRDGEERLNFRFPDLDSNMVSINEERFRNKVVVIQIMGSWCPNCMDETAFLADWYKKNRNRGVEVIALAYEYTKDFRKAERSLRKFQQRHDVQYPMLNTGVLSADSLKTEKTLPQMTPIKAFPTTIFIGRDGKVKEVHPGFEGPGTGEYYEEFKKTFNATIERLLRN